MCWFLPTYIESISELFSVFGCVVAHQWFIPRFNLVLIAVVERSYIKAAFKARSADSSSIL